MPIEEADGYPRHFHPYVAWDERLKRSAGFVGSAFAYEISFSSADAAVLADISVAPHTLHASLRVVPCCVVASVPQCMANIVYPGDIVARVNEELLVNFEQPVTFDKAVRVLAVEEPLKIVRLLRPAGVVQQPSPGEAVLLAVAVNVTARFDVINNGGTPSLQMKTIDAKAPSAVRKLLGGTKVVWDPYSTKPPVVASTSGDAKSYGVYKDRSKWVAVSRSKRPLSSDYSSDLSARERRCFYLGRFETESEANKAFERAQDEISIARIYMSSKCGRVVPGTHAFSVLGSGAAQSGGLHSSSSSSQLGNAAGATAALSAVNASYA